VTGRFLLRCVVGAGQCQAGSAEVDKFQPGNEASFPSGVQRLAVTAGDCRRKIFHSTGFTGAMRPWRVYL
jgi:hypothetical protein